MGPFGSHHSRAIRSNRAISLGDTVDEGRSVIAGFLDAFYTGSKRFGVIRLPDAPRSLPGGEGRLAQQRERGGDSGANGLRTRHFDPFTPCPHPGPSLRSGSALPSRE